MRGLLLDVCDRFHVHPEQARALDATVVGLMTSDNAWRRVNIPYAPLGAL